MNLIIFKQMAQAGIKEIQLIVVTHYSSHYSLNVNLLNFKS